MAFTIGGCASARSPVTADARTAADGHAVTIRFDNEAREHVHVYLVGARREWLLGRVETGARATLRIPDAALADDAGSIQLAVVPGSGVSLQAAREGRTVLTILQPTADLLSQRWTYSQTQATGRLLSLPASSPTTSVWR